jgi:hypothetical protein
MAGDQTNLLDRYITTRNLLFLFILFLLLSILGFPMVRTRLTELSGGIALIDTHFLYTPGELYRWIEAYGPAGRSLHAISSLTLDLVYPLAYGLFLALAIAGLYRLSLPTKPWPQKLSYMAFGVMLFDYLENFSAVTLLLSFPRRLPWLAGLISIFTPTKWVLGGLATVALFAGLVIWWTKRPRPGKVHA